MWERSFSENAELLGQTAALIGGQLRELREYTQKTQAQVAAEAGLDVTQLSRIENGQQIHLLALHRQALVEVLGERVNVLVRLAATATAWWEAEDYRLRAAILQWWASVLGKQEEGEELAEPGPVDRALVEEAAQFTRMKQPLTAEDAREITQLLGRTRGGVPRL